MMIDLTGEFVSQLDERRREPAAGAATRPAAQRYRCHWYDRPPLVIPLVLLLIIAGLGSSTLYASSAVTGAAAAAPPPSPQSMNILLMGVDTRPGQPIDIGVRPDFLEVLHLDPENGSCRLLAIPRDSRVELPGYGLSKINHALMLGGIPYERQVVEQFLGITIDHYGLIDFNGFQALVDAVGGVTVDNPYAFTAGDPFPAGPVEMDGTKALEYARFRDGPDGDFGRIKKQQQIIRAVLDKVASDNPVTTIPKFLGVLRDNARTDLSPAEMIGLGFKYRASCTSASMWMATLPGTVATYEDPIFNMPLSYVVEDPAVVKKMTQELTRGA